MAPGKRFWLMKSEPDAFSIDDLKKRGSEPWSGVRNYQARNFMRDQMQPGDLAFLYHSSCPQPGIYGVMEIAGRAYPDPTQFDRRSDYYDAKSTRAVAGLADSSAAYTGTVETVSARIRAATMRNM